MSKVFDILEKERQRQEDEICLIASENYMSKNVMKACGSEVINKYSEGYPNHRYYGGCQYIDELETYCQELACKLFNCKYANVQPNSGCQANQAIYMALLKPNDTILGMGINEGGHISHTLSIGFAGTYFKSISYGLDDNGIINYEEIKEKLYKHNPRLLIAGASAYSRIIDFERIRKIVDEYNNNLFKEIVNKIKIAEGIRTPVIDSDREKWNTNKCYLMVDMAHIAGLVATGLHPSPFPSADVVSSTVQKTLRSGRGGIVLTNDENIAKQIDKAVFPRLQGGPLNNMIAGKAVGFEEALTPEFRKYQEQVLENTKAMDEVFKDFNIDMVSGGSDNHLILLDLSKYNISGQFLETVLGKVGIVVNKNAIKNDPRPKTETSGVRIGTPAITTRGMGVAEVKIIATMISVIIKELSEYGAIKDETYKMAKLSSTMLCNDFPIYKD